MKSLSSQAGVFLLVPTIVFAMSGIPTACPSQQSAYGSSASEYPKPTGDLSSYISSYSSAHSGVFSNCESFTSTMPASLTAPYQSWVTSASDWSVSFESMVSTAASTCVGLVANVVIATPLCPDAKATGGDSSTTSSAASPVATGSSTATTTGAASSPTQSTSAAGSLAQMLSPLFSVILAAFSMMVTAVIAL